MHDHSRVAEVGPFARWLYTALTAATGKEGWNFEKALVGKDDKVISKFALDVEPESESAELLSAIEKALEAQ